MLKYWDVQKELIKMLNINMILIGLPDFSPKNLDLIIKMIYI